MEIINRSPAVAEPERLASIVADGHDPEPRADRRHFRKRKIDAAVDIAHQVGGHACGDAKRAPVGFVGWNDVRRRVASAVRAVFPLLDLIERAGLEHEIRGVGGVEPDERVLLEVRLHPGVGGVVRNAGDHHVAAGERRRDARAERRAVVRGGNGKLRDVERGVRAREHRRGGVRGKAVEENRRRRGDGRTGGKGYRRSGGGVERRAVKDDGVRRRGAKREVSVAAHAHGRRGSRHSGPALKHGVLRTGRRPVRDELHLGPRRRDRVGSRRAFQVDDSLRTERVGRAVAQRTQLHNRVVARAGRIAFLRRRGHLYERTLAGGSVKTVAEDDARVLAAGKVERSTAAHARRSLDCHRAMYDEPSVVCRVQGGRPAAAEIQAGVGGIARPVDARAVIHVENHVVEALTVTVAVERTVDVEFRVLTRNRLVHVHLERRALADVDYAFGGLAGEREERLAAFDVQRAARIDRRSPRDGQLSARLERAAFVHRDGTAPRADLSGVDDERIAVADRD